jgi:hypothetical protein
VVTGTHLSRRLRL